jgi:hypothetical protein
MTSVVLLWPNCPKLLPPQVYRYPSAEIAALCICPKLTVLLHPGLPISPTASAGAVASGVSVITNAVIRMKLSSFFLSMFPPPGRVYNAGIFFARNLMKNPVPRVVNTADI